MEDVKVYLPHPLQVVLQNNRHQEGQHGLCRHSVAERPRMLQMYVGLAGDVINHVPHILLPAPSNEVLLRCTVQHADVHGEVDLAPPAVERGGSQARDDALGLPNVAGGVIRVDVCDT